MPNKHFCQGPNCHTNPTQDRFLKSKGIIRGRYAYSEIDGNKSNYGYYGSIADRYFCSQTCKHQWLNENMENIERGIPIPFITHRRISEGYEKATEKSYGGYHSYKTIRKIRVDNDNDNDRIIP
jgi:YHS domain-containing protein